MEPLTEILRGPYAYLLIAQILIVAGLSLFMVWLIYQRMLGSASAVQRDKSEHGTYAGGTTRSEVAYEPAEIVGSVNAPQYFHDTVDDSAGKEVSPQTTDDRQSASAEPNAASGNKPADTASLQEQVSYLESKLLEYQIVQEEIGTLSMLKAQNEELKNQLNQLRGEPTKQPPISSPDSAVEPF